jgi:hypothetical protein
MAIEATNSWLVLAEHDDDLRDAYSDLTQSLVRLLPNDTEAAAGALIEGRPGVVALAGTGFFVVTFELPEGARPRPTVERLPRDVASVTLLVQDNLDGMAPAGRNPLSGADGEAPAYTGDWTLTWSSSRRVTFRSVVRRFGGFHDGPDDAERFGRTLAAGLGWTVPD